MQGIKTYLRNRLRDELVIELEHRELGGVEDLVTKLAVAVHARNL